MPSRDTTNKRNIKQEKLKRLRGKKSRKKMAKLRAAGKVL